MWTWLVVIGLAAVGAASQLAPHPRNSEVPPTEVATVSPAEPMPLASTPAPAGRIKLHVMFVTASSLNVRASPSTSAAVLGKFTRGGRVVASDANAGWIGIQLLDGTTGWVDGRYLSADALQIVELHPARPQKQPARPAYDRDEVVQQIIRASIARYPGNCPCPYNTTRNGRSCRGNSAYLRPGGRAPLCFAQDVTQAMIDDWIASGR